MVTFMVAILHDRCVIECFRYEGNISGELFSQFVRDKFPNISSKENNQKEKLFLQNGDPSQNRKMFQEAMDKINGKLLRIPHQPPDLNAIKNIFHLVTVYLRRDAIKNKIERETYEKFCIPVTNILHDFPSDLIDWTIALMPKLIDSVIKMKG